MQTIELIDIEKISLPPINSDDRTTDRNFVTHLAHSIATEGLIHPIMVRPDPFLEDRFILVVGRHRLHACKDHLGWTTIPCIVTEPMTEDVAEMTSIAENLWRSELSAAQKIIALQRWRNNYFEKTGKIKGEKANEIAFNSLVSGATGESVRSVKNKKRLAISFTPEQLEVFNLFGTTRADMQKIAEIEDEKNRGEAVALLGSGMEIDEVIRETEDDEEAISIDISPFRAKKRNRKKHIEENEICDPESDISDDDWANSHCVGIKKHLGDSSSFISDIGIYRKTMTARVEIRKLLKPILTKEKKKEFNGPLYWLLHRLVNISHPKDWKVCLNCQGLGIGENSGIICGFCQGYGYKLATEDY